MNKQQIWRTVYSVVYATKKAKKRKDCAFIDNDHRDNAPKLELYKSGSLLIKSSLCD